MTLAKRSLGLQASIVCANMLKLGEEVAAIERAGIEMIHFDVMDGLFVPRYGLHPEMLQAIRTNTELPIDVHMMVNDPEPYLESFVSAGATYVTVHVENNYQLLRTIQKIQRLGAKPGLALNPATPLSVIECVLDEVDLVMLMGINPGIVGHSLWSGTFAKIADLKSRIGHGRQLISVDGGVNFNSAPKMAASGADLLVCGTSTIYRPPVPLEQKVKELRAVLAGAS